MERIVASWHTVVGFGWHRTATLRLGRALRLAAQVSGLFPVRDDDDPQPWPAYAAYGVSLTHSSLIIALLSYEVFGWHVPSSLALFLFATRFSIFLLSAAYRAWHRAALCDLVRATRAYLGQYPLGAGSWRLALASSAASFFVEGMFTLAYVHWRRSHGRHVGIGLMLQFPRFVHALAETAAVTCPAALFAAMAEDVAWESARLVTTSQPHQRRPQLNRLVVEDLEEGVVVVQDIAENAADFQAASWQRLRERQRLVFGWLQEAHRLNAASILFIMSCQAVHCTLVLGDTITLLTGHSGATGGDGWNRLPFNFMIVAEYAYRLMAASNLYAWSLSKRTELLNHATGFVITNQLSPCLAHPAVAMTSYRENQEPQFSVLGQCNFSVGSVLQIFGVMATYVVVAHQGRLPAYFANKASGRNSTSFAG